MKEVGKAIWIFGFLLLFTLTSAYIIGGIYGQPSGNVALISVKGEIVPEPDMFVAVASSDAIVADIENAVLNPEVEALLIEINSPGGTVVSTREIASALKAVEKPTVCWMRDVAASGAYWIASTCDFIVADEFTITGSIGVSGSYLEFSDLFEKYGIGYVKLVSGEHKDTGTPFREPTAEELAGIQSVIDEMHGAFISEVAENRNLSIEHVTQIADGSIFTGKHAQQLGLIDLLGGKQDAINVIKQMTNLTEIQIFENQEQFTMMDLMSQFMSKQMMKMMLSNKVEIKAM